MGCLDPGGGDSDEDALIRPPFLPGLWVWIDGCHDGYAEGEDEDGKSEHRADTRASHDPSRECNHQKQK